MSFLGSSPRPADPAHTRKLFVGKFRNIRKVNLLRLRIFYFFPAGPLRADDPCDFFIASSPYPIRYNQEGLKWTQTFFESFESIDVALCDVATRMYRRK
jgi:hypothetical protein